jgi:hypothetical protein
MGSSVTPNGFQARKQFYLKQVVGAYQFWLMIGLGYIGTRTRLSPSDLDGQVRLARLFTRGLGKVQIQQGDQLEAGKMGREPAVIGLQGLGPGHRVHG